MAEFGRASSFLPTVKCSMCAADIQISKMGDHVCEGGECKMLRRMLPALTNRLVIATSMVGSRRNLDSTPFKKIPSNGSAFLKPGRAMPPRVDTSIASTGQDRRSCALLISL